MTKPERPQNIINCTGHTLHVYDGGKRVVTLPAGGPPVRIDWVDLGDFTINGLNVVDHGHKILNLPPERADTWYVVSYVMAMGILLAGVDRPDILAPGPKVSDRGRIIGCRGLHRVVR